MLHNRLILLVKSLTLTLCFSMLFTSAFAGFEKAYVVTNQKDTVQGWVRLQRWTQSPKTIEFKTADNQVITYTSADINSFYVFYTQELFVSKKVALEVLPRASSVQFQSIGGYANREKKIETVEAFVRVISKGKLNLYVFNPENIAEKHYLIEKDGVLTPLVYHIVRLNGTRQELNTYQNQIKELLQKTTDGDLAKLDYDETSLKKYVDGYNKEFGMRPIPKARFAKMMYGAMISTSYSEWRNLTNTSIPATLILSTSISPGLFINFAVGRRRGVASLLTDVYYDYFNGTVTLRTRGYDVTYAPSQSGFKLFHALQYRYDFGKFGCFAEMGINTFIPLKRSFTESYLQNNTPTTLTFAPFSNGSAIGLGAIYKQIEISLRLGNNTKAYAPIYGDKASFRTHRLVVKYNFNQ